MITAARGLNNDELEAIAALEARVVAADGGRLKLEWGVLGARPTDQVRDFLCWEDGNRRESGVVSESGRRRLIGFAGLYTFGQATTELAGMVDPEHRRRGIGTALLDAAAAECGRQGNRKLLLVTPRNSAGGSEFADRHGGRLEHSEHAMLLCGGPATAPSEGPAPATHIMGSCITVRQAVQADIPRLDQILREAFGYSTFDRGAQLKTERWRQLTVERGPEVIGGLRVSLENKRGGVYGFAIAADQRGNGFGREALRRACVDLRERGADRIGLEVATDNDRALGLYESLGFKRVITEDYYELSV